MRLRAFRGPLSVGLLGALAGCGGGGTGPSEPTSLEIVQGRNQTAAAGSSLPVRIVIKASNSRGPLAAITVTLTTESDGGGSTSPRSRATGEEGTAEFTWTLGPRLGIQVLTATTTGSSPLTASTLATATVGPPASVLANTETFQFVVVARPVPILPVVTVTDGFGNPVPGVPVTFEASQGTSILTGTSPITDQQGVAGLGSWAIGASAGSYRVRASIPGGASTSFEARGIPAALTLADGAGQSANAGTAVPVPPAVRTTRDDGTPLPGVEVAFAVVSGGGTVVGGSTTTGFDGVARPTHWILGTTPGVNRLEAVTSGRPAVVFEATAVPAVPTQLTITGGTALSGFFGNYLIENPEVTVTDAGGSPVAGVPVTFQVSQGGGQITGPVGPTDFLGRASITSWRLGAEGSQAVSASAPSLPPVEFGAQAAAPPATTFRLEVRYATGTTPTESQRAVFDAAAERWTRLIVGGAPPYRVVPTDIDPSGSCPSMLDEVVDGMVLHVRIQNIQNNPNILGATGLCVIRDEGFLTVQALMFLNSLALANLETSGQLLPVILHELAHAIGFGTLWDIEVAGLGSIHLIAGGGNCSSPAPNPTFSGAAARAAFYGSVAAGSSFSGLPVPIENSFGCGTAYSHWRKSTFGSELLTGILGSGPTQLSAITVQSFRDLGYVVNDALADLYAFQAFVQSAGAPVPQLTEIPLPGDIRVIDRRGRTVARIPRSLK